MWSRCPEGPLSSADSAKAKSSDVGRRNLPSEHFARRPARISSILIQFSEQPSRPTSRLTARNVCTGNCQSPCRRSSDWSRGKVGTATPAIPIQKPDRVFADPLPKQMPSQLALAPSISVRRESSIASRFPAETSEYEVGPGTPAQEGEAELVFSPAVPSTKWRTLRLIGYAFFLAIGSHSFAFPSLSNPSTTPH